MKTRPRLLFVSLWLALASSSFAQLGGTLAAPGSGLANYVLIADVKASGSTSGDFTSGAWQVRVLNTIVSDASSLTTLPGSNTFTLPAGSYQFRVRCPAFTVDRHQARLYNVTDSAVALDGTSEYASGAGAVQNSSWIVGRVTINATKTFRVEHRCSTTATGNGLGVEVSFGDSQKFATVEIWKE